jgi:hypothetical protein
VLCPYQGLIWLFVVAPVGRRYAQRQGKLVLSYTNTFIDIYASKRYWVWVMYGKKQKEKEKNKEMLRKGKRGYLWIER